MRWLLAVLFLALIGAAPAHDWRHIAARTPDGTYIIGNPQAPAKLTEYLSLTCPHCALLSAESQQTTDAMIADGSLRIELRHATRDSLDLTATLIARCVGGAKLRDNMHLLFGLQPQWAVAGEEYMESHHLAQLPALADASGLTQIARGFGLERPRVVACLANRPEQLLLARMSGQAWHLMNAHSTPSNPIGTPSFELNGKFIGSMEWAGLEPQLRHAGAH